MRMLTQKLLRFTGKIAMFLVVFASLAPSISHALAAQSNGSFLQEICSSNGSKKIVIQIVTSQGQQLSTVLDSKAPVENAPTSVTHHLEHCPFCSAGAANLAIAPAPAWVLMLAEQAKSIHFDYATPVQTVVLQTAHPSRAPPVL